jgi:hypothetical protein
VELPRDAGFETLAGFLQFQLGYIPREGQTEEIWRAQPRNTSEIDTSPLNSDFTLTLGLDGMTESTSCGLDQNVTQPEFGWNSSGWMFPSTKDQTLEKELLWLSLVSVAKNGYLISLGLLMDFTTLFFNPSVSRSTTLRGKSSSCFCIQSTQKILRWKDLTVRGAYDRVGRVYEKNL